MSDYRKGCTMRRIRLNPCNERTGEMIEAKHTPGPWHAAPYSTVVGCPITAQPDPMKNAIIVAGTRSATGD